MPLASVKLFLEQSRLTNSTDSTGNREEMKCTLR